MIVDDFVLHSTNFIRLIFNDFNDHDTSALLISKFETTFEIQISKSKSKRSTIGSSRKFAELHELPAGNRTNHRSASSSAESFGSDSDHFDLNDLNDPI